MSSGPFDPYSDYWHYQRQAQANADLRNQYMNAWSAQNLQPSPVIKEVKNAKPKVNKVLLCVG